MYGDWCSKIVRRRGLRKKLQACELTAPSKLSHWRRTYGWQLQQTSQELDQAHFSCLSTAPASTCMHANDQFNLSLSLYIYIYIVYRQKTIERLRMFAAEYYVHVFVHAWVGSQFQTPLIREVRAMSLSQRQSQGLWVARFLACALNLG